MTENFHSGGSPEEKPRTSFRARFAQLLGVEPQSKENLYLELSRGATLYDLVYWLQILFSAGIATLGLVLNSPAVIIGAMLISPLMGPILAAGLALASGDMILGLRALAKLFLSCALAVFFAVFLVAILPFREMTNEIAARTQPNTLDLFIALFSGAVGSIAVCREVKGVATSIPGVAIAVALMPPLCVAGYGLGLIAAYDAATGSRIATGGGLLFLTNLVAITFTAMVVFLAVQLNTPRVAERAEEWEHNDPESAFLLNFIERLPALAQAREIRSLPIRFAMILVPLVAIMIPLSQAFNQLQREMNQERRHNEMRKEILALWQENFQKNSDGNLRSSVDQLTVMEKDGKLSVDLRVFDDKPYTINEKNQCTRLIALRLNKPVDSVNLHLTEIPTTLGLATTMREREKKLETESVSELQAHLWQQVNRAMSDVQLPPGARLLSNQLMTNGAAPLHIKMVYLGEQNIEPTLQATLIDKIRTKLKDEAATVSMERIPINIGFVEFARNDRAIPVLGMMQLDFAGRVMRENPQLTLSVASQPKNGERAEITEERVRAISAYLETRWQISPARIRFIDVVKGEGKTWIGFEASDSGQAI